MKDDKGLAVMIGVGKPKDGMGDSSKPEGDMGEDICFPLPQGLDVSDGDTVNLPTKYNVRDGNMYPIEVAGKAIQPDENDEANDNPDEENSEQSLDSKREKFKQMAMAEDKQLGYEG